MKNSGFSENGIMPLLKELLLDNNEVMVSFQKGEHALRRWRKNGIVGHSVIAGGNIIKGKISSKIAFKQL